MDGVSRLYRKNWGLLANQKYKFFIYKQQVPLYQFSHHPPQTHPVVLKTEAVGSAETSRTTFLIWKGKTKKMPPFKRVPVRHVCAQCMTVGCAVYKTLSVLHKGL
jgi:hypothetical protein